MGWVRQKRARYRLLVGLVFIPQQQINRVVNGGRVRMTGKLFQTLQCGSKCGLRNSHGTILPVATQFDPFRLHHQPGPEPVEGPLPSVYLMDDEDDLHSERPRWLRAFAIIVITVFLGVSVLTAIRQVTSGLMATASNAP